MSSDELPSPAGGASQKEAARLVAQQIKQLDVIASALTEPVLSAWCKSDLARLFGSSVEADRVEALCWLGNYRAARGHAEDSRIVAVRLRRLGCVRPRGKRPKAHLVRFVEDMLAYLPRFGVQASALRRSPFFAIVDRVAVDLGIEGEWLPVLRRELARRRESEAAADAAGNAAYRAILEAVAQAWALEPDSGGQVKLRDR